MGNSAIRLTLYALLSSIETNFRKLIAIDFGNQLSINELLGSDVLATATTRLRRTEKIDSSENLSLQNLLYYIDFGDLHQIINRRSSLIGPEFCEWFRRLTPRLEKIVSIRNRVAHSRPLEVNDFPLVYDFAKELVSFNGNKFTEVNNTLSKLEKDPSFVFGIQIPYLENDVNESHNLPIPDFDETGFIGRTEIIGNVIKYILGPYPVITIVGEGGLGKTALALKVAYDILDMRNHPFDAVVWSTAKTTQLTTKQIFQIDDAINTSLGLIEFVSNTISGQQTSKPIDEVITYLNTFKILLILDNLETVIDKNVRRLLEELQVGSKVLITSRIGLGAYEYPVKLTPLEEHEALQLLRTLAQLRGVDSLTKVQNKRLSQYCRKMHNNPGFIKWFVSAVQAGQRPEEVLDQPEIFLEFCMSNVYRYLSENSKLILRSMQSLPGRKSQAELAFLNKVETTTLQKALQELLSTNMVQMTSTVQGSAFESRYEISELARAYLDLKHPLPSAEHKELTKRWRQLISASEEISAEQKNSPFSFYNIHKRSQSDIIVAKYLLDVLNLTKAGKLSEADDKITEARRLAPEYFEVHRVEAWLRTKQSNYSAARNSYEAALELENHSSPLHFWYAGFLMRYFDDIENAVKHIQLAEEITPNAYQIMMEKARFFLYQKRFDEAKVLLDEVMARTDVDFWWSRKFHDLMIQYFQRLAEFLYSHHNEVEAFQTLENMMDYYLRIPKNLRDKKMVQKLEKAIPTATLCSYNLPNPDKKEAAIALIEWINNEAETFLFLGEPKESINNGENDPEE